MIFADYYDSLQPGLGVLACLVFKRLEEGHMCLDPCSLDPEDPAELPEGILDPGPFLTHDPTELKPFIFPRERLFSEIFSLRNDHSPEDPPADPVRICAPGDKTW